MTNSMRGLYIESEAEKGFKDWEIGALEFILKNYDLSSKIESQIKSKIEEIK
mgnify:FL=1